MSQYGLFRKNEYLATPKKLPSRHPGKDLFHPTCHLRKSEIIGNPSGQQRLSAEPSPKYPTRLPVVKDPSMALAVHRSPFALHRDTASGFAVRENRVNF
jgi:hypothetical protein